MDAETVQFLFEKWLKKRQCDDVCKNMVACGLVAYAEYDSISDSITAKIRPEIHSISVDISLSK